MVTEMLTRRQMLAALASPVMLNNKYSIIDPHVHVWKHDPRYPWAKETTHPPEKDATPEMLPRADAGQRCRADGHYSGDSLPLG